MSSIVCNLIFRGLRLRLTHGYYRGISSGMPPWITLYIILTQLRHFTPNPQTTVAVYWSYYNEPRSDGIFLRQSASALLPQQVVDPGGKAFAGGGGEGEEAEVGVDFEGVFADAVEGRVNVGQEVNLVDDADVTTGKHVGVFEGFVIALGDADDDHALCLAEVEHGGTHEVAHVFNEQQRAGFWVEVLYGMAHTVSVEVTSVKGVDLHGFHALGGDAACIVIGLLVTFDYGHGAAVADGTYGGLEERRLARAGR